MFGPFLYPIPNTTEWKWAPPTFSGELVTEGLVEVSKDTAPTGTVVVLASGGPHMTIDWEMRNDGLPCVHWFDGTKLEMSVFPPAMLRITNNKKKTNGSNLDIPA